MTNKKITKCTGPECDRDAVRDGLCLSHGQQMRLKGILTKLRPRAANGTVGGAKSKPGKTPAPKKVNKRMEDEMRETVVAKQKFDSLTFSTPPPKVKPRKRTPLLGLREWICPKCLEGGTFLGSQASHRCTMNKNLITDWVLKENHKPAVDPNP